jgi:hypothetical protein
VIPVTKTPWLAGSLILFFGLAMTASRSSAGIMFTVNAGQPSLSALMLALQKDPAYQLRAPGPYDTTRLGFAPSYGIYAICLKVQT